MRNKSSTGIFALFLTLSPVTQAQAGSFTDPRDGTTYETVLIENMTVMAENLNYKDGSDEVSADVYAYDGDDKNRDKHGLLYKWEYAKYKACPPNWHLPTYKDWKKLKGPKITGKNDTLGIAMKSKTGWIKQGNGTNASGFNALPSGYRNDLGAFKKIGMQSVWWTSIQTNDQNAWTQDLDYNRDSASRSSSYSSKLYALSVRCFEGPLGSGL